MMTASRGIDMRYQLVLQWPSSGLSSYDYLLEVEDRLIAELSDRSAVDGHDQGSEQFNIFILTEDPVATFDLVKTILNNDGYWSSISAAYRELNGDTYKILWPQDLEAFEVI